MKILTGDLKGRAIFFKPNRHLRPTADKTRKAIFDMLQGQMEGKRVLDLFSGTGALGFEALSSGARFVTFVEKEKNQAALIQKNLITLGMSDKARVMIGDFLMGVEELSREEESFDFIFIDPPYDKGLGEKAMTVFSQSRLILDGGFIILECRKSETLPKVEDSFTCLKNKIYGDSRILVYRCIR